MNSESSAPSEGDIQTLDDAFMREMFNRTSLYTLDQLKSSEVVDYLDDLEMDEESFSFLQMGARGGKRGGNKGNKGGAVQSRKKPMMRDIEMRNAYGAVLCLRRKRRDADPFEVAFIRPTNPMPLSICKSIRPLHARISSTSNCRLCRVPSVSDHLQKTLLEEGLAYQACIIDPPFYRYQSDTDKMNAFNAVRNVARLVPKGFLFVWTEKALIREMVYAMEDWGFTYVENICWVYERANNQFLHQEAPFFRSSHATLLVMKSAGVPDIRHQRRPDVVFDYVQLDERTGFMQKPIEVCQIIETLLPTGCWSEETQRGQFLYLWSGANMRRKGWTAIHEPHV
jgi:hypothetical protein